MSGFIDPEQQAKQETRRAWKLVLGSVIVVFGLFAGLMLFYDCSPPDDSGIMPKFTESPEGHNPLAVFLEELRLNPLGDAYTELSPAARTCLKGTEPEMKAYLVKQTEAFQAFEKLMLTDSSTWRWPGGEEKGSYRHKSDASRLCSDMVRVLRMKARVEISEQKMQEAVSTSLQTIKFCSGLEAAEGQLINYLVAISSGGVGRYSLELALISGNADAVMLEKLQHEIESMESKRQNFITTLLIEVLAMKTAIKAIKGGEIVSMGIMGEPIGMKALLLKPNLSHSANVYYMKPVIDGFKQSWKAGWTASQKMKQECEKKFPEDRVLRWINPNAYGNMRITELLPIYETMCGKALINVTTTRLVVLTLAMRRYELERGKLPETLDELVPNYLPMVPTDPFDDAPMRWNPGKKVIYSLGEDGSDDGGEMRGSVSFSHRPDIGTIYWWSEEARVVRDRGEAALAEQLARQRAGED